MLVGNSCWLFIFLRNLTFENLHLSFRMPFFEHRIQIKIYECNLPCWKGWDTSRDSFSVKFCHPNASSVRLICNFGSLLQIRNSKCCAKCYVHWSFITNNSIIQNKVAVLQYFRETRELLVTFNHSYSELLQMQSSIVLRIVKSSTPEIFVSASKKINRNI